MKLTALRYMFVASAALCAAQGASAQTASPECDALPNCFELPREEVRGTRPTPFGTRILQFFMLDGGYGLAGSSRPPSPPPPPPPPPPTNQQQAEKYAFEWEPPCANEGESPSAYSVRAQASCTAAVKEKLEDWLGMAHYLVPTTSISAQACVMTQNGRINEKFIFGAKCGS
jgi:hypothetical protein